MGDKFMRVICISLQADLHGERTRHGFALLHRLFNISLLSLALLSLALLSPSVPFLTFSLSLFLSVTHSLTHSLSLSLPSLSLVR